MQQSRKQSQRAEREREREEKTCRMRDFRFSYTNKKQKKRVLTVHPLRLVHLRDLHYLKPNYGRNRSSRSALKAVQVHLPPRSLPVCFFFTPLLSLGKSKHGLVPASQRAKTLKPLKGLVRGVGTVQHGGALSCAALTTTGLSTFCGAFVYLLLPWSNAAYT